MARVAIAFILLAAFFAGKSEAMSVPPGPTMGTHKPQVTNMDSSMFGSGMNPDFSDIVDAVIDEVSSEMSEKLLNMNIQGIDANFIDLYQTMMNESKHGMHETFLMMNLTGVDSVNFTACFRKIMNESSEELLTGLNSMAMFGVNPSMLGEMFHQVMNKSNHDMMEKLIDMGMSEFNFNNTNYFGGYTNPSMPTQTDRQRTGMPGQYSSKQNGGSTTRAPITGGTGMPGQYSSKQNGGSTTRAPLTGGTQASGRSTTRRTVTERPTQKNRITTQAIQRENNDLIGRIEKDSLTKEQQRKLEEAFGSDSTSSFTGSQLFDPTSGNLTGEFWDTLDNDEKQAMDDIQRMGREAFDLEAIFSESLPDDFVFFTQTFANMDQTAFQKFIDSPQLVQPEDLQDVSLSVLSAMNETTLRSKLERLPSTTQDKICTMLQNEETDYDSTKRLVKGIDCPAKLAARKMVPCGSLSEAIAENKMEEQPPKDWDNNKWTDAMSSGWMSGLPKEVIERCPANLLRQNMDKVKKFKDCLDNEVREKVLSKVQTAMGGFSRMNKADIEMMGDMVGQMSYREMKNLDSNTIKESMSTFKDSAASMNRLQKMQIKKSVKESGSVADWTGSDIVNSAAFCGTDKNIINNLPTDKVIQNLTELGSQEFDRRSSRAFATKIRESSDYDEPSDFDTAKFKTMGKLASGFTGRFIKNMTAVNFGDVLNDGSLRGVDFPKDSARAVVDRIKTELGGSLNQANLENLDKAVVGLRKDEIDNVNGDDLANALENMKDTIGEVMVEMDDTTIASMVEKVETASGGLGANLEKMGPLLQKVPVKKLQHLSDNDFGDMSGRTERNFNCSSDTCPELYKRVKNTIGTPSLRNPNFTLSTFKNLKRVMCGMPLDDLRSFPATTVLEDVAGYLLELKCLSDKQERVLAEKLKYRLGLFSGSVKNIRRQDVRKYGGIMKHFSVDELKQLDRCTDITLQLGIQDLSNIKKEDLKRLANYALECVNKTQGQLTTDDVTTAGDLICGLSTNRIKDIASDAISDVVFNVQSKCSQLDIKERQQWTKEGMKKLNITSANIQNVGDVELTQMGSFTGEMDKSTLNKIPNDVMSSVSPDIVDQFTDLDKKLESMDEKGFGNDVNSKVRNDRDKKQKQVYTKMIESFSDISSGNRRKKRSTTALTCDDMQLLGSGVTAMSTTQIEAMADSDFIDCAQTLGGYSTWDSNQLLSLLTVATRSGTYGNSASWTADHVYNVGIIAQGLTSSELLALTQLSIDSMYSIGRHEGWSETQLSAGFSRWLSLNKNSNATTVTSTELISLGHFACGASTNDIGDVDSTVYSYAASYIGALTSCQESQLVSWASHAKTAFGAVTTWDTSVINTIGTVIGGLTANELGSLTTTQVAAIQPSSIAEIPAAAFVGFTVDQLSGFSTAQALSTTASQQAGLSSAQLSALQSAGATIYGAGSTIQVSCISMILAMMVALMLK